LLLPWIVQAAVVGDCLQLALPLSLSGETAAAIEEHWADLEAKPNDVEAQSNLGAASVQISGRSFWTDSSLPATPEADDTPSVTLGLKVYSDVSGTVTGIRFYKGAQNTGTHVGTLWSSQGTKLAEVTFSGETASGWQQAHFSPVNIVANKIYVISYLAPNGHYACDQSYSWAAMSAAPLHVAGSTPGVFAYGAASTFPTGTWNGSNYWIDLVFAPGTSSPPSGSYTISGAVSGSAATLNLSGAATGSTVTDGTGQYTFSGLANGSYVVTPSQSGSAFTPSKVSVTVNGKAIKGVNFTATPARPPVPHSVLVTWTASVSSNIVGYKIYRSSTSGGPYTQIGFIGGTSYADTNVFSGRAYFYVVTTVDDRNNESVLSTQVTAVIPKP
jgi:hypothetical protein